MNMIDTISRRKYKDFIFNYFMKAADLKANAALTVSSIVSYLYSVFNSGFPRLKVHYLSYFNQKGLALLSQYAHYYNVFIDKFNVNFPFSL